MKNVFVKQRLKISTFMFEACMWEKLDKWNGNLPSIRVLKTWIRGLIRSFVMGYGTFIIYYYYMWSTSNEVHRMTNQILAKKKVHVVDANIYNFCKRLKLKKGADIKADTAWDLNLSLLFCLLISIGSHFNFNQWIASHMVHELFLTYFTVC